MSKEEQEKEEKSFAKKLSESTKPNIIDVKMDPEGTDAKVKNT